MVLLNVLLGSLHEVLANASGQIVAQGVSLHHHLALVGLGEFSFVHVRHGHSGQASAYKQQY